MPPARILEVSKNPNSEKTHQIIIMSKNIPAMLNTISKPRFHYRFSVIAF